jgi:site-specific DNA-methyltransferase (adenine-specific)
LIYQDKQCSAHPQGRYPSNLLHDGSDEVLAEFAAFGERPSGIAVQRNRDGRIKESASLGKIANPPRPDAGYTDSGTAARFFATCPDDRGIDEEEAEAVRRFFYSGKATRRDRNEGLGDAPEKPLLWSAGTKNPGSFQAEGTNRASQNAHPTVKPVNGPNGTPGLMRYLCRLITPPNGIVLDPFSGSFSTGKAAMLEGFRFVGIEREEEYVAIGRARIEHAYATRRAEEMKGDERLPL